MGTAFVLLLIAYLVGAIPFGLLTARLVRGIDIRQHGSGNIGATNVGRVLGAKWGAFVLLLDALKGAVPTALLPLAAVPPDDPQRLHLQVGCGLAAVLGHMFPCWLKFRGGKGVATALGVIAVLSPWGTLWAVAAFATTFALSRIVSASSIFAALTFCVVVLWRLRPDPFAADSWSLAAFAIAVPLLIVVRHRSNLGRLMRGEEKRYRLGESRKDQAQAAQVSPTGTKPERPSKSARGN